MPSLLSVLGAVALAVATASAGSFTSDFSNPLQGGFVLTSNYALRPDGITYFEPVITDGHLVLTWNENNEQGTIVLDEMDGYASIESFTATFKLQIGPGSGNAADGTSFCFGPDVNAASNFGEDGTGTGVIVSFDIYDNGGAEAPAVDVMYGGNTIATTKFAKADMVTGVFEDVEIQVTRSGTISVSYKGETLYDNLLLPDYMPTWGQFAIGARTGGENANQWIDDLTVTTTVAGLPVAPSITSQPQSQTVEEGQPVTFSIGFDGSAPLSFQWLSNNVAIAGANSASYTIDRVPASADGARYKCTVSNSAGSTTSNEATLTVIADSTPPTLVSVRGSLAFDAVTVTFSEPVDPTTAQLASNYQISGGINVSAATLAPPPSDNVVVLTTSPQPEGATLTVTVDNVEDVAGNPIAPNSQMELRTFVFMSGAVLHKKYNNFGEAAGSNPDNLFNDPRFPNAPDRQDLMAMWEYPADGDTDDRVADPVREYFDTLEGFFIPPTTGNYVFFTAGADRWWLYLSTNDDPANKCLIAAQPGGWTQPRNWNTGEGPTDATQHRSDLYLNTQWPTFWTITLNAGQRYYMLEVHHDPPWAGADDFSATYKLESELDPQDGEAPRLAGSVVGSYVDPSESSIDITQQPADITQESGRTAVFTVIAAGTDAYGGVVTYQWQRQAPAGSTWTDVANGTGASYETPLLTLADDGAKYQVLCTVAGLTVTSDVATLTVVSDIVPPTLAAAGAIASQTGTTFDVGVTFDEAVDPVSAGNMANYSLSAGTLSGIQFYAGSPGVVLTVSGLTVGGTYTVTVENVKDLFNNTMTPTSKEFTVSAMKWGVVGANELGLGNGVLATAEDGFDIYSDGVNEWAAWDEATFVYEEVTGDFDKVVRVEYQDASSQWARAGLIARDVTNFGVDRTTQEAGAAGRYQKVHVNPATTIMGTPGNNEWETNRRLMTGAQTTEAGGGGVPLYPNAWCRLQRAGSLFTMFRSNDGVTWTQLGTTTFPPPFMPETLFVGPEYSPENQNLAAEYQGMFLAKFRDYGDYSPVVTPTIGIGADGLITYTGVLQSSATIDGTYAPVPGAISPYPIPRTGTAMFYRTSSQ